MAFFESKSSDGSADSVVYTHWRAEGKVKYIVQGRGELSCNTEMGCLRVIYHHVRTWTGDSKHKINFHGPDSSSQDKLHCNREQSSLSSCCVLHVNQVYSDIFQSFLGIDAPTCHVWPIPSLWCQTLLTDDEEWSEECAQQLANRGRQNVRWIVTASFRKKIKNTTEKKKE